MPFDAVPMGPLAEDSDVTKALIRGKTAIASPRRWGKDAEVHQGRYCALGAVRWAGLELPTSLSDFVKIDVRRDRIKAMDVLNHIARKEYGCMNVAWFNDNPRTKHRDIMVLFDRAIELSRTLDAKRRSHANSSVATASLVGVG